MQYVPPLGATDPNASYIEGNPGAGIRGSYPTATGFEAMMREICNAIAGAGLTPDPTNLQQLSQAIQNASASPGEGLSKVSNAFALNLPSLAEEDTIDPTDLVLFYQEVTEGGQASGHHRKTNFGNFATKILNSAGAGFWLKGAATTGTSALETTLTPVPPAGSAGFFFSCPITTTSTLSGGVTQIDFGLGLKPIVYDTTQQNIGDGALPGATNCVAIFYYDGTYARLINVSPSIQAASEATFVTSGSVSCGTAITPAPVNGALPPWILSIAGGVLTIAQAGLYQLDGLLTFGSTSTNDTTTYYYTYFYRNGVAVGFDTGTQGTLGSAPTTFTRSIHRMLFLKPGDTISLCGACAVGSYSLAAGSINAGSEFHITKIA